MFEDLSLEGDLDRICVRELEKNDLGSFSFLDIDLEGPKRVEIKEFEEKENQSHYGNQSCSRSDILSYSSQDKAYYKEKLLSLVAYYKNNPAVNNGYGLVPVINSFTAKHKYNFQNRSYSSGKTTPESEDTFHELLRMLNTPVTAGMGLQLTKKDFRSKVEVRDGMRTVLYKVELKNGRLGVFQGIDRFIENKQLIEYSLNQFVVFEMDGGYDMGVLREVEDFPLIAGVQEVPFMPLLRTPTYYDYLHYSSKEKEESLILNYCRDLLEYQEFSHYNMKVTDVEVQIDRKKIIIFATFKQKVKFNKYVKQVYEYCKFIFKKSNYNAKPRVFIQNKFV